MWPGEPITTKNLLELSNYTLLEYQISVKYRLPTERKRREVSSIERHISRAMALGFGAISSCFLLHLQHRRSDQPRLLQTSLHLQSASPATTEMVPKTSHTNQIDILIIGAGPAGLACASGLARLLHTCVVFSAGPFRNEKSKHMHGVLTWEHRDPCDFRDAASKDLLAHYDTISFQDVVIENIEKTQREDRSSW